MKTHLSWERSARWMLTLLVVVCATQFCWANEDPIRNEVDPIRNEYGFNLRQSLKETKIPFELLDNLIVIPVKINEEVTVKAILDTGVRSFILYGKKYLHLEGLNFENSREVDVTGLGSGKNDRGVLSFGNNLDIEGLEGNGIAMVHVLRDTPFQKLKHYDIEAIFGYQIFTRFIVEIDYRNHEIIVKDPDFVDVNEYSFSLPIKIIDTKPYVEVEMDNGKDKKMFNLLLDTGASSDILLYEQAFEGYLDRTIVSRKMKLGRGFNGTIMGKKGILNSMSMQEIQLEKIPYHAISIKFTKNKFIEEKIIHGLIGANVLSNYKVTFDYIHKRAYFEKSDVGKQLIGS